MGMNRKMRRASASNGRRLQKLPWDPFEDVTFRNDVLEMKRNNSNYRNIDKVYRNNRYIVMVYHNVVRNGRPYIKVMCRRSDGKASYSWQDLFRIKNEIFGDEVEAIQFLPKKSELVDEANLYWFFVPEKEK